MKEIIFGFIFCFTVFKILKWLFTSDAKKQQKLQSNESIDLDDIPPFTPKTQRTPLSGSFRCPVCGAATVIKNQMYPIPKCQYCDSPIPDFRRIVEKYDSIYQANIRREQEDHIAAAQEAIRLKNKQLEADKNLEHQRLRNKQIRMEKRRNNPATGILEVIFGAFLALLLFYVLVTQVIFRR